MNAPKYYELFLFATPIPLYYIAFTFIELYAIVLAPCLDKGIVKFIAVERCYYCRLVILNNLNEHLYCLFLTRHVIHCHMAFKLLFTYTIYMHYLMASNQTMIPFAGKNHYLLSAHLRPRTLMISLLLHLSISMGI